MTSTTTQAAFTLNGGHPVLDFVNTLDFRFREQGPIELVQNYDDLLRFMRQAELLSAPQARVLGAESKTGAHTRVLRSARELREAVAATLYGVVDGLDPRPALIGTLERYCLSANRHRELRWRRSSAHDLTPSGASWVWGRFGTEAELPVWMLSQAAFELMSSRALDRLRACGSEDCRWLFLDTSKNHSRRWCDMKICGNRMKARRFHARRQR